MFTLSLAEQGSAGILNHMCAKGIFFNPVLYRPFIIHPGS